MDFIKSVTVESKAKKRRRLMIMRETFELCVKEGIRNLTIPKIMTGVRMDVRSFYNYYSSLDVLMEDLMMLCMAEFYRFDYLDFSKATSLFEVFKTLGTQFVSNGFKQKSLVLFMEDFDHQYNRNYISERYSELMKELFQFPLTIIQQNPDLHIYARHYDNAKLLEAAQFYVSSLFSSLARLIRRENIYRNQVALLSHQSLEILIENLAYSVSEKLNDYKL